ncbi:MAG: hypothetical protein HY321_07485 [Armatimonadetes bacterium]|nr:hypothetical protein [Armatimonadota bacterium]
MMVLHWERISEDQPALTYRTQVPGGWLVVVCELVRGQGALQSHTKPVSACFVPDEEHAWSKEAR